MDSVEITESSFETFLSLADSKLTASNLIINQVQASNSFIYCPVNADVAFSNLNIQGMTG